MKQKKKPKKPRNLPCTLSMTQGIADKLDKLAKQTRKVKYKLVDEMIDFYTKGMPINPDNGKGEN